MKYEIIPAAEVGLYRLRNVETGRDVISRPIPREKAITVKRALEHNAKVYRRYEDTES